jgi:hypothetical protein
MAGAPARRHDHAPLLRFLILVTTQSAEGGPRWGWVRRFTGDHRRKKRPNFWALLCPASLRYARSRQAGPQKRDHERAGRKSASHASQRRVSTAVSGASALRPFAGGLSTFHRPPAMKRIFAPWIDSGSMPCTRSGVFSDMRRAADSTAIAWVPAGGTGSLEYL